MNDIYFIITYIFSYLSIVLFFVVSLYRFFTWQSAPKNLEWSLFPLPEKFINKLLIMAEEILFMKLIYKNNRRLWLQSLILHYGFYLIIIWLVLTLIGVNATIIGIIASYLMLIGGLILLISRFFIVDVKLISHVNQYFNLFLIIILALLLIFSNFFYILGSDFLYNVLIMSLENEVLSQNFLFYLTLLVVQFFLIYIPSSSMVHFFAKYFTWDKIRWSGQ